MPRIDLPFNTNADASGQLQRDELVTPELSGRVISYRIVTESGCSNRTHETTLSVVREDDPSDRLDLTVQLLDCDPKADRVDFRVRRGKNYRITLASRGFAPNEQVKGMVSVEYRIGADSEEDAAMTGDPYQAALGLNRLMSLVGSNLPKFEQERRMGANWHHRIGESRVFGPMQVKADGESNVISASFLVFIASHYDKQTFNFVNIIVENEEVFCRAEIEVDDTGTHFSYRLFQDDHRNVPSQTMSRVEGDFRSIVAQSVSLAREEFANDTEVSKEVNTLLNDRLVTTVDKYVAQDLNTDLLQGGPVQCYEWACGIKVESLAVDLVRQRVSMSIGFCTLSAGISVKKREQDFAFGTVLTATVSGSLFIPFDARTVDSDMTVSIHEGGREYPQIARNLQEKLNSKIEEAALPHAREIVRLIRENVG
jgi:hypothetical protein